MTDRIRHQLQALKNEEFFQSFDLSSTPYLDWAMTSLFYAALHLVDAYVSPSQGSLGQPIPGGPSHHHVGGHTARREKIINDPKLAPISKGYHDLKQRCDAARYDLLPLQPGVVSALHAGQYTQVKNLIDTLI